MTTATRTSERIVHHVRGLERYTVGSRRSNTVKPERNWPVPHELTGCFNEMNGGDVTPGRAFPYTLQTSPLSLPRQRLTAHRLLVAVEESARARRNIRPRESGRVASG